MLTTVWPRSCSGYRPQLAVVLGSPGCPGPPQPTTPPNGLVNHSCVPAVHPAWRLRQPQLLPGRPSRLTASPTTAAPWPYANHARQPHCYAIRTSEWTSTCLRYQAEKRQCSCRRFPAFEPGLQLHGQLPRRKYPPGSLLCRR